MHAMMFFFVFNWNIEQSFQIMTCMDDLCAIQSIMLYAPEVHTIPLSDLHLIHI